MAEIQRADARSRTSAMISFMVVLIGGVVLWVVFDEWMAEVRDLPMAAARQSLSRVFSLCLGIMTLCVCGAGWYCWWWGRRIRASRRFPLPGASVLRETVVLSGHAAVVRGVFLQVLGGLLLVGATILVLLWWWVLRTFGEG